MEKVICEICNDIFFAEAKFPKIPSELDRLKAENTELKKEISRLKVDLSDAEMRKEDTERLLFLIENEYVVKQGIDSFWLAEPDGTSRIGSKCVTPIEAIDKYRKEHP